MVCLMVCLILIRLSDYDAYFLPQKVKAIQGILFIFICIKRCHNTI